MKKVAKATKAEKPAKAEKAKPWKLKCKDLEVTGATANYITAAYKPEPKDDSQPIFSKVYIPKIGGLALAVGTKLSVTIKVAD